MPIIAAHIYCHFNHRTPHPINTNLSYVENFLLMITGELPHPIVSRTLEVLLIAHAEHELNCSTAMMRHLTSSGVDVYSCIAGSIAALYGRLHGGANE